MGAGRISWTGGEVDLVFDAGVTDTCPGSPSSRQVSLGRNFRQDAETLQDERPVGADFRSPHGSTDVARISLGYPGPTGRSRQGRSRPPGPIFWPLAPCGRPQLDEPTPPSQSLRFGDLPFSTGMRFGAGRRLNPLLQHQFRRFPHAGISARVGHGPHQHRRRSSTAESHRLSGQLLAAHVFQHRRLSPRTDVRGSIVPIPSSLQSCKPGSSARTRDCSPDGDADHAARRRWAAGSRR